MLGKWSLRHCRIKRGKETRSFLIRSPFDIYPSQTSKNQVFTIREMILCGNLRQMVACFAVFYTMKCHKSFHL